MSNKKGKDKKNEVSSLIQKQYQSQKRQLIDAQFRIKYLQEKLAQRTSQVKKLHQQLQQIRKQSQQTIQQLILRTNDDEKRLGQKINKLTDLQIRQKKYQSQIDSLKEELIQEKAAKAKEVGQWNIKYDIQKSKQSLKQKDYDLFYQQKESRQRQLQQLRQIIQLQKAQRVRQVADKERQKVQATDKLRDQMLNRIRDMRTNLLSLKKQQLQTTTRLTILQNHQLTSQLQYQSKQTQKLIFKDEQMHNEIKKLNQQLIIHKEVQDQLAKRAHFSKGVIKKLNQKVQQLQKQLQKAKECQNTISQNFMNSKPISQQPNKDKQTIDSLQRQLQQTQKKYTQLITKFQALQKQKDNINYSLTKYQKSSNDLVKIFHTYYQQIDHSQNLSLNQQNNKQQIIKINLKDLRQKDIDEWSHQQIYFFIRFILNLMKPYITRQNIMIPSVRKNLIIQDPLISKSCTRLPKIIDQNQEIKLGKKKIKDLPVNIASKIVASNLREWGNTVKFNQNSLKRKYKISQSYR